MTYFLQNKSDIEDKLHWHGIENYTLIPDEKYGFIVNVDGDVEFRQFGFTNISIKFNHVTGSFSCYGNKLTSLEFSPKRVDGSFICMSNKLESLEFCPEYVGKNFDCSHNKLKSLKHCPQHIAGDFSCDYNKLVSLEFCPEVVEGKFNCNCNLFTSLEFLPKKVFGMFNFKVNHSLVEKYPDLLYMNVHDLYEIQREIIITKNKQKINGLLNDKILHEKNTAHKI